MAELESAWRTQPDYEINFVPCRGTARVWHGDTLLAQGDAWLRLEETRHVDRFYFPMYDVRWEHFTRTEHHTICPFKGEADYWTLHSSDPQEENLVWAYRHPFDEVAGIAGHVAFYEERVRIELADL